MEYTKLGEHGPGVSRLAFGNWSAGGDPSGAHRIAILGTGKMGSAIAERLVSSGFDVVLWNRTRARAEALGIGSVADTPAAAVREADLVISSLTGPEAVLAAYTGPEGALMAATGKPFAEMSTAGPELVADLAPLVSAAGAVLVDAPILGSPAVVRAQQAAVLVGGTDDDVAPLVPVLESLGTVRHVGPLGSAARLKLVANSMLADVVLAAAELQVAGERVGLDPHDVFWALERLAPSLAPREAGYLEDRQTPALFALRDLRKDLDLATAMFGQAGADVPLTRSSADLVRAAADGDPGLEITAVIRRYRLDLAPVATLRSAGSAGPR